MLLATYTIPAGPNKQVKPKELATFKENNQLPTLIT
jgi:hypothetical protein